MFGLCLLIFLSPLRRRGGWRRWGAPPLSPPICPREKEVSFREYGVAAWLREGLRRRGTEREREGRALYVKGGEGVGWALPSAGGAEPSRENSLFLGRREREREGKRPKPPFLLSGGAGGGERQREREREREGEGEREGGGDLGGRLGQREREVVALRGGAGRGSQGGEESPPPPRDHRPGSSLDGGRSRRPLLSTIEKRAARRVDPSAAA